MIFSPGLVRVLLAGAAAFVLGTARAAPVAVVDRVVDKKGTRKQAQGYLEFLYSPAGQEIVARHRFRPRLEAILQRHAGQFKPIQLFAVDEVFGGWAKAQQTHFADGGVYDQIAVNR